MIKMDSCNMERKNADDVSRDEGRSAYIVTAFFLYVCK